MISYFNNFMKSWVWKIIFTLIMIPFMFLGMYGIAGNSGSSANDVAIVGDSSINLNQYQKAYQETYNGLLQQMGEEQFSKLITPEFDKTLRNSVLDNLVERSLAFEYSNQLGIDPTYDQIVAQITKNPNFFDSNGKFNNDIYLQVLQRNNITPNQYAASIASDLKVKYIVDLLKQTLVTPTDIENSIKNSFPTAVYQVAKVAIKPDTTATFTDQQIQDYYNSNQKDFVNPAKYTMSYFIFKPNSAISEQQIEEYYQNNKSNYSNKSLNIYSIELKDLAQAQALRDSLTADNFLQVAQDKSIDATVKQTQGLLGSFQVSDLPVEFAQNLQDASKGFISNAFLYNGKGYILFVQDVIGSELKLAQVSSTIKSLLVTERNQSLNDSFNTKFEEFKLTKKPLSDLAKELNVTLQVTNQFTATTAPEPFKREDIVDYIFSSGLGIGQIADKLTLDEHSSLVFSPIDYVVESIYPLSEVQGKVVAELQFEQAKVKLESEAQAIIAKGSFVESDASLFKLGSKQEYQLYISPNHDVYLDQIFKQPVENAKPSLFTTTDKGDVYIVQVNQFKPGTLDKQNTALFEQKIKDIFSQLLLTEQYNKLKNDIKVVKYEDRINN